MRADITEHGSARRGFNLLLSNYLLGLNSFGGVRMPFA
jgi:hypothetical protein